MQGYQAKLYYNATPLTAAPTTTGWTTSVDIVKDVTLNDEFDQVETTTRASAGRKTHDQGLQSNDVEIELAWDPTNTGFQALRTAKISRAVIALAIMDGPIATSGSTGIAGNFKVASFTRKEPLAGQITATVKLAAHSFMGDLTVSG
jgi:hypothetical protein